MEKFTYEQFERQCNRWNMTVEEGYRAMCFTANILGENIDNCLRYNQRVENNPNNSSAVKNMAFAKLEKAQKLMELYLRLDEEVFDVLEAYADAHDTKLEIK
jgi:hypothetical protein